LLDYYKTYLNKTKFEIHVIGGEPTLWSKFEIFAKHFKEHYNCLISISSNGSRTIRWWEENGRYFDEVMLSCHHQQVDVDHLINVANVLYKKNVWTTAMVLMDSHEWDKCESMVNQLKKSSIGWPVNALDVRHDTIKYTDKQTKYLLSELKKIPNLIYYFKNKKFSDKKPTVYFDDGSKKKVPETWLTINKKNNFYGWKCNVGIDTIYINKDGYVTGACNENLYNLDYKFNLLDNDFNKKFKPILLPTICYKLSCDCQPESNCRKEKISNSKIIPILSKE
jgi:organic radical activating enzyme